MTGPQDGAVSLVQTRLHRLDGAVEQRLTKVDGGYIVVDVRLAFPSTPLVQDSDRRHSGMAKSSIEIGAQGAIKHFQLRLPPLPADDYRYAETYTAIFSMAQECSDGPYIAAHLAPEGVSGDVLCWWPHIYPIPDSLGINIAPNAMMLFVYDLFHQYCERYEGGL